MAVAMSQTTSHSSLPTRDGNTGRTRSEPALGVGEGAVLLQERRTGQEDVREARGLVEEQVLHDDEVHRAQRRVTWLMFGSDWAMSSPCT